MQDSADSERGSLLVVFRALFYVLFTDAENEVV
jgi:hypothetical protein